MSYVVHLWEHPLPRNLRAADQLHATLASMRALPNPKWERLRHAVEAAMAAQGECLLEWPENAPPEADHPWRSCGFLIDLDGPEAFQATLVREATRLGFTVYDDQAGAVFLPYGLVMTAEGTARLASHAEAASPIDIGALMAGVHERLLPRLIRDGFEIVMSVPSDEEVQLRVERQTRAGGQSIKLGLSSRSGKSCFSLGAFLEPRLRDATVDAIHARDTVSVFGAEYRGLSSLLVSPVDRSWHSLLESIPAGAQEGFLQGLVDYYELELGPALSMCRSVKGLLALSGEVEPGVSVGCVSESNSILALAWEQDDALFRSLFSQWEARNPAWVERMGRGGFACLEALARP